MPLPPGKWRAGPMTPLVGEVPVSLVARVPAASCTECPRCHVLRNPLAALKTARLSEAGGDVGWPQWRWSGWAELPLISGMRTQMAAAPAAASHESISKASGEPSAAEKRRSAPSALVWEKGNQSPSSRTSTGKPVSDSAAGRLAPSGVVRMVTVPWWGQSANPGTAA